MNTKKLLAGLIGGIAGFGVYVQYIKYKCTYDYICLLRETPDLNMAIISNLDDVIRPMCDKKYTNRGDSPIFKLIPIHNPEEYKKLDTYKNVLNLAQLDWDRHSQKINTQSDSFICYHHVRENIAQYPEFDNLLSDVIQKFHPDLESCQAKPQVVEPKV